MSKWDNFKKSFGEFADKTVNKTRELTDTASLKIKIANKEAERDIEYKNLGRLAYSKLKADTDQSTKELTRLISETIDKIDEIIADLDALKAEDDERKAAKEAEKAAKEAEKKARREEDEAPNLAVMDEFNKARKEADVEYEKAKQAADDATKDAEVAAKVADEVK